MNNIYRKYYLQFQAQDGKCYETFEWAENASAIKDLMWHRWKQFGYIWIYFIQRCPMDSEEYYY